MKINKLVYAEKHLFDNIKFFPKDIKTLILGSFPVPLYTQRKKFFAMSLKDRSNSWYYGSKKNEFWKIINEVYYSDKKYENFLYSKKEKIKLFNEKKIGIADVISKCERKNKESSKDTDLIILDYNNKIIDLLKRSQSLMRILFTSRFTENHFLRCLKKII